MAEEMWGVVLTGHGGLETLEWRDDLTIPALAGSDVLVEVGAAGINNTDINTRVAWYSKSDANPADATWSGTKLEFPRVQGADVCGRIVAVGRDVPSTRIGERVLIEPCIREAGGKVLEAPWYLGSECDGGFAQFVSVASRHAYKIDSDMTDVELASFPCSYSTAENMLTRSRVGAGDTVLVTGASGGVGSAAVQLARARGADVVAVTSASKVRELTALGATKTIRRDDDLLEVLGADRVDVVVDLVAGPNFPPLLDVLRRAGRYVVAGAIGGPIVELDVRTLYLKDLSLLGCTVLETEVFGNLVARIEHNEVVPLVAATYPLSEITAAQEAFVKKRHTGKIVLEVG